MGQIKHLVTLFAFIFLIQYITSVLSHTGESMNNPKVYTSNETQSQLVELYSSEGCSSCPPADRWMSKLKTHSKLWKSIVPVTFHVDYWNRLGWIDTFSNKRWTERQHKYARRWKANSVYTPGFVNNGKEWKSKVFLENTKKVGVLKVTHRGNYKFDASYTPHPSMKSSLKNLKVFGVILGHGLESQILAGENNKKTLNHEFVVLQLNQKKLMAQSGSYTAELEIPLELTASPRSLSVAFWVESQEIPIQSTGGELIPTLELATFAGGCFWCMESPFEKVPGVFEVISGYTDGKTPQPTYKQVSSGTTGHTEAIRVVYNPEKITYKDLLEIFWKNMDPTDSKGQFADRGHQYRPGIYYHNEEQKKLALESKKILTKDKVYPKPIALDIKPVSVYYLAETYHQDYYKKNPIRYNFYRSRSGRDKFLEKIWSQRKGYQIFKGGKTMTYTKPSKEEIKKKLTELQFRVTQKGWNRTPL